MLKSDYLGWISLRVIEDNSNDLKVVFGDKITVEDSRMRNAVPLPTTEEMQDRDTGRRLLINVWPWGMLSNKWAEVVLRWFQVSVQAKMWMMFDSAKSAEAFQWRGLVKDLKFKAYLLRREWVEMGPGFDWIFPKRRMRMDNKIVLVWRNKFAMRTEWSREELCWVI